MDYKEKYEEALERARALHEEAIAKGYVIDYVKDYETIFPELKESEDERTRKALIAHFTNNCVSEEWAGLDIPKVIAWLEKQKEQKHAEWSERDEKILASVMSHIADSQCFDHFHDISKEDIYTWLKSLRPQPKCEWGEEDEENFKWFDKFFRAESIVIGGKDIPQDKYLWFKSLRRRPKASDNWKPSEEQMEWLESAVKLSTDKPYIHGIIISLYEQLKRL